MQYLFVYGTLKSGYNNHGLIKDEVYMGKYKTSTDFTLQVNGLPYLVPIAGKGAIGEVYLIDKRTLRDLDLLEGHPDWYTREEITVTNLEDGSKLKVHAYVYNHLVKPTHNDILEY